MALPGETLVVIQVRASLSASELSFTSGASPELLSSTTKCRPCKNEWGLVEGEIVPTTTGEITTFARVRDQPHLLAFPGDLLDLRDCNLLRYMDCGIDLLPVQTDEGGYLLYHTLSAGNAIDPSRGWKHGRLLTPHFIRHRIGPGPELCTNVGCNETHIFLKQRLEDLPSALGGLERNDRLPSSWLMSDCQSLIQEYFWRGWTGLEFEVVWRDE